MTLSLMPVLVGLRMGRWILPLVAVVFASTTVAYAHNGATAGGSSAGDHQRDVQVAVSTGEATGVATLGWWSTTSLSDQSADLGAFVSSERCAPIGSGYMDSSIVAESRKIDCGWAP